FRLPTLFSRFPYTPLFRSRISSVCSSLLSAVHPRPRRERILLSVENRERHRGHRVRPCDAHRAARRRHVGEHPGELVDRKRQILDRKSTRLNSSHVKSSYA